MKQIPLWGHISLNGLYTLVDDEDYDMLNLFRWHAAKRPHTVYARTYIDGKQVYMHQLILSTTGKSITPDHRNHNGLDNRRENLKLATQSQQTQNCKVIKGKSGYLGVFYVGKVNKYLARIQCDGIMYKLGYFKTKEEAALAYNEKAIKLFGEFAKLNIIK